MSTPQPVPPPNGITLLAFGAASQVACPKCQTPGLAFSYLKAGQAWDGAPETLQLRCGACGYGNDGQIFMSVYS